MDDKYKYNDFYRATCDSCDEYTKHIITHDEHGYIGDEEDINEYRYWVTVCACCGYKSGHSWD